MCVDTVKMRLPITEGNIEQIEQLQIRLMDAKTIKFWSQGNMIDIGEIEYSRVTIGTQNFFVTVSLPKVLFGTNIQNLSAKQTAEAIDRLCEILQLDISEAAVTKLHIAHTFEVEYSPRMYLEYLGERPHRHRWNCTPDTVYYDTLGGRGWKQFYCYDKGKESARHISEDSIYADKNLLRMELRLEHSPSVHLGAKRPPIRVKDLANVTLQRELRGLLVAEYNAIHKCRPIVDPNQLSESATPKDVLEYLLVETLQIAESHDPRYREKFYEYAGKYAGFKTGESFRRLRPKLEEMIDRYAVQGRYAPERELTAKVNALLRVG